MVEVWVFRWVYPKNPPGFFWVRTQVSEPWFIQQLLRILKWCFTHLLPVH